MNVSKRLTFGAARHAAVTLLVASLLVACQMTSPGDVPLADDEITVTSLDAPVVAEVAASDANADTPKPKPRPDTVSATETPTSPPASEPEPETPKSAEQVLCEKTGGQWAVAGKTGAHLCVSPTRDGGKMCRKKSDCEGQCLARSGTCAPFMPLFGCNDVLEQNGSRVTLCID
jgi:hypothetical protein